MPKYIDVSGSSFVTNIHASKKVDISSSSAVPGLVTVKSMNVYINCDISNCHLSKMYEWVFTYDSATVNFIYDFSTATSSTCVLPVNDLTANFNIVITNVPTDTSKTYSVSFVFT
jgi:hypothetical protein